LFQRKADVAVDVQLAGDVERATLAEDVTPGASLRPVPGNA
jgi:hypothetical protein